MAAASQPTTACARRGTSRGRRARAPRPRTRTGQTTRRCHAESLPVARDAAPTRTADRSVPRPRRTRGTRAGAARQGGTGPRCGPYGARVTAPGGATSRAAPAGSTPSGGRTIPRSVTMAVTSAAGVTSNAGLCARVARGAVRPPPKWVTSPASRCSTRIAAPPAVARSIVAVGAATTNGIAWCRARTASGYVPILLATSPFGRDAVRADDHDVDVAGRHERAGGDVSDERVVDAQPIELPCGQPCPLEHRARLVDPHVGTLPGFRSRAHDPQGGAVPDARERPGVAVREDPNARRKELRPRPAERSVRLDVLGRDRMGFGQRTVGPPRVERGEHAIDTPCEVDRCRSRVTQTLRRAPHPRRRSHRRQRGQRRTHPRHRLQAPPEP